MFDDELLKKHWYHLPKVLSHYFKKLERFFNVFQGPHLCVPFRGHTERHETRGGCPVHRLRLFPAQPTRPGLLPLQGAAFLERGGVLLLLLRSKDFTVSRGISHVSSLLFTTGSQNSISIVYILFVGKIDGVRPKRSFIILNSKRFHYSVR